MISCSVKVYNIEYGNFGTPASSHTRLEFPESVRLKNYRRHGRFDGSHEPFGCSVIKNDGFAKLVSSVRMKPETHC